MTPYLTLTRFNYGLYGVTGELRDEKKTLWAYTLEHSYQVGSGWSPKVAPGFYRCKRGVHFLEPNWRHPTPISFSTFEVESVPPFMGLPVTGILFHVGNYNKDSNGCILLGAKIVAGCITDSEITFTEFMKRLEAIDAFTLQIS